MTDYIACHVHILYADCESETLDVGLDHAIAVAQSCMIGQGEPGITPILSVTVTRIDNGEVIYRICR